MQVTEIKLMKRKNLGNYEHKEVEIRVALSEGEDSEKAFELAEAAVTRGLEGKKKAQIKTSETKKEDEKDEKTTPKKSSKKTTKKTTKKASKKATSKSSSEASEKEVLQALREYAKAKKDKNMAVAVMEDVTGETKLGKVDKKMYKKLIKALKV